MEEIRNWEKNFEICIYAKKLLDKVTSLNIIVKTPLVNIVEVKKAIYYARKYHGSQTRQSGEPFYSHPIEVAYMVSDYLFRTDILVTSILHDTLEDTELTKEQISQGFGAKIANQVMDLTRIKGNGIKISAAKMVEMLYQEKKYDVLLIKLFDRLHNMQTINAKSPEKIHKTVQETISRFLSLSIYFKLDELVHILLQIQGNLTQDQKACQQYYDKYYLPFPSAQSKIPRVHIQLP